jgi:putative ABC transport system substrate-binding protein
MIKRRELITLLGGAVAWPLAARAQQAARMRRIGVLMAFAENDPDAQANITAFQHALQKLGWTDSGNVHIDYRWGAGDAERIRAYAVELVGLKPDVILAVTALVLKEMAPQITRVAVLFNPEQIPQSGMLRAVEAVAPSVGVQLTAAAVRDAAEIERAIDQFAREPSGGLIVLPSGLTIVHRGLVIALAARYRLPAIYQYRQFVTDGGLISYGNDLTDQYRQAASYVDRILRGEKPGDLPVQQPTKFELIINLKTAKTLGLEIPPSVLARADEVIE